MNYLKFIALSLFTICILSCSDNDNPNFTQGLKSESLENLTQTFEIDLDAQNNYFTISTEAGCAFQFNKNRFSLNGNPISGKINIEIIEIFDKGTMCITGKHTMAGESLLISGGEFYLNAYQGTNELDNSFFIAEIPSSLSGPYSTDMQLFSGGEGLNSTEDWVLVEQVVEENGLFFWDSTDYTVFYTELEWFNCDKFFNDPRPKTKLNILVPSEFNADNSVVYLAIKGEQNSLGIAAQGEYPVGLDVQLIFISEVDDKFLYQTISTTVAEDEEYKFERDKMTRTNPEDLKRIINDLD